MRARARARARARSGAAWRSRLRCSRGSSRRATCMVIVEPPETMWPLATNWIARASERQRIDAVMLAEAFVLVGEQQRQETRIDVLRRRREPPASVRRSHRRAADARRGRARRANSRDPCRAAPARANRPRRRRRAATTGGRRRPHRRNDEPPAFHFAPMISMVPVAVRPKRSGRYMSSTFACGST